MFSREIFSMLTIAYSLVIIFVRFFVVRYTLTHSWRSSDSFSSFSAPTSSVIMSHRAAIVFFSTCTVLSLCLFSLCSRHSSPAGGTNNDPTNCQSWLTLPRVSRRPVGTLRSVTKQCQCRTRSLTFVHESSAAYTVYRVAQKVNRCRELLLNRLKTLKNQINFECKKASE